MEEMPGSSLGGVAGGVLVVISAMGVPSSKPHLEGGIQRAPAHGEQLWGILPCLPTHAYFSLPDTAALS